LFDEGEVTGLLSVGSCEANEGGLGVFVATELFVGIGGGTAAFACGSGGGAVTDFFGSGGGVEGLTSGSGGGVAPDAGGLGNGGGIFTSDTISPLLFIND